MPSLCARAHHSVGTSGQALTTYLLTDFPDRCHTGLLLGLHASSGDNPSVWMAATAHEQHLESEVTGRIQQSRKHSQISPDKTNATVTKNQLLFTPPNNFYEAVSCVGNSRHSAQDRPRASAGNHCGLWSIPSFTLSRLSPAPPPLLVQEPPEHSADEVISKQEQLTAWKRRGG